MVSIPANPLNQKRSVGTKIFGINPFMKGTKTVLCGFEGSHANVTGAPPPRIRFRRELTPRGFEGNSCTSVRMRREPSTACTRASCSNGGATNPPQRSPPVPPPPAGLAGSAARERRRERQCAGGGLTGVELMGARMAAFTTPLQTFGWRMGTCAYGRPCTFSELARRFRRARRRGGRGRGVTADALPHRASMYEP